MDGYNVLAKFYEDIILDETYNKWVESVVSSVNKYSPNKKGIDLACGSGIVTRALKKAGFFVTGIDLSQEMLEVAKAKSIEENLKIDYLLQDMKNFKFFEKVGFITVINDGFNYLTTKDLAKTLSRIYKSLVNGGVLVFDVSTKYKLTKVLSGNMFGDNSENLSYMWFNTQVDGGVKMDLTFFKKEGDNYKRYDQESVQYYHEISEIQSILSGLGFKVISVLDSDNKPLTQESERACFIAIKE